MILIVNSTAAWILVYVWLVAAAIFVAETVIAGVAAALWEAVLWIPSAHGRAAAQTMIVRMRPRSTATDRSARGLLETLLAVVAGRTVIVPLLSTAIPKKNARLVRMAISHATPILIARNFLRESTAIARISAHRKA